MKILVAVDMPWYDEIVRDLRKNNEVDYVFKCFDKFQIENRNYHIPKLLGFHRGYLLLAGLIVNWLLLTRNYDFCLTDYRSAYLPTVFPIFRRFMGLVKTRFIYDIRTIPVDYDALQASVIERKFYQQVHFANSFYQGITVITPEMKRYLQNRCTGLMSRIGIWESGVDTELFKPLPRNRGLRRKVGFDEDDFVCFYHGSLSNARGVIELVEAFRTIKEREQSIKLLILGRGESTPKLLQIIKDADMEGSVKIHDWVANSEVPQFISTADLCIIPLPDIDWWRVSSPLKLMEYIACGKNILMTDIVAHLNAVGRNDDYFWVHETTAASFAQSIIACYTSFRSDPRGFYEKGMAGRARYADTISWECRARSLRDYFSLIAE